jgi:hypothetical protein
MLTVITPLGVYPLDQKKLSTYMKVNKQSIALTHANYLELDALVRGEKVSLQRLDSAFQQINESDFYLAPMVGGTSITIRCGDGSIVDRYTSETLARHFTLFRDFFEDYPEAKEITIPNVMRSDVNDVLSAVVNGYAETLNPLLYTLEVLNPFSNAVFLSFDMTGTDHREITRLLAKITPEERESILCAHRLRQDMCIGADDIIPLPPGPAALLGTSEEGLEYLATKEGSQLVQHNGWLFVNAMSNHCVKYAGKLIISGFTNDAWVPLTIREQVSVCNMMSRYLEQIDESNKRASALLCAMFGYRHELLGNMDDVVCAPFSLCLTLPDKMRQLLDSTLN